MIDMHYIIYNFLTLYVRYGSIGQMSHSNFANSSISIYAWRVFYFYWTSHSKFANSIISIYAWRVFYWISHSKFANSRISIYVWRVSLLKDLERCVKNLIWSRDNSKRKLVIVAWEKVCKPYIFKMVWTLGL
jgi:hypothetical protein